MPQQYEDPLKTVIQGMLQGHALATSIHRQRQEDEAFARHTQEQDREAGIQDILLQMRLRDQGAVPVMNGMVEERRPGFQSPRTILGGQAPDVQSPSGSQGSDEMPAATMRGAFTPDIQLPGSQAPSGTVLRKARSPVTIKGPTGTTQWELPTEDEKLQGDIRRSNTLEDAKVENDTKRAAKLRQAQLTMEGGGMPAPEGLQSVGVVPGTRLTRQELVGLTEAAQKIQSGNRVKLGEGDTLTELDPTGAAPPKTIATGGEKKSTGDFQQVYLPAYAKKLGKTVETLTPQESLQAFQQHATDTKDPATLELAHQMTQANLEMARARLQDLRQRNNTTPQVIEPGTREFRIAQDLAYGKLTMQQFRSLTAYSRDTNKKMDIYDKASELNPNFNPASFEMGMSLAKNPKVQQQLASLDNVVAGIPDLLKFSSAASRSGVTLLNKFVLPGGFMVGGKKYSDFHTAQLAFADELSGGLGFGGATDMSRQMGINMTDPNMTVPQFESAVKNVVEPFVQRKKGTLLKQMGVYGMPGMNPAATEKTAPDAGGTAAAPKTAADYLKSLGAK